MNHHGQNNKHSHPVKAVQMQKQNIKKLNQVEVKEQRLTQTEFTLISQQSNFNWRKIIPRYDWHIMVDERICYKVYHFYDTKNGMVDPTYAKCEK